MHEGALLAALRQEAWPENAAADLACSAHIVAYDRRAAIFRAGESADLLYVLLSGEVKLLYEAKDGASVLVSIARPGKQFGVFAPTTGRNQDRQTQLFTARSLSRCKVAIISANRVARALQQLTASQLVAVLESAREEWVDLSCRLLAFMTMSVRCRLVHSLAEIAADFGIADSRGKLITLRLSHDDLASLVGASRPMVSRLLKQLTDAGVLTKAQGRYVLLAGSWKDNGHEAGAAHRAAGKSTHDVHNVVELDTTGRDAPRTGPAGGGETPPAKRAPAVRSRLGGTRRVGAGPHTGAT